MKDKESKEKNDKKDFDKNKFKKVVKESADNIVEGAREVGEISSDIFAKISEFYDSKVKPGARNLYQSSSDTFEQVVDNIQTTIDKYKNEVEVKNLNSQRNKSAAIFGMRIYQEFMKNGSVTKKFLQSREISALIKEIHQKEVDILKTGEILKQKEK